MPKPKTLQNKLCPACGAEFSPKTSAQRFCSVVCKNKKLVVHERKCPQCNTTFEVPFASTKQKYCSITCKIKASTADKQCTCKQCCVAFERPHGKFPDYCSRSCAITAKHAAAREKKNASS